MFIYVSTDSEGVVVGWGTPRSMDEEIEIEVEDNHPFFSEAPTNFKVIDGKLVKSEELALRLAQEQKDQELNLACKESILAGFSHEIEGQIYWFSYDMEAQGNFRDAKEMLSDGLVEEIPWTVRLGGSDGEYARLPINLPLIKELSIVIMHHKTGLISKYRDFLMPIVNGAETPEEVNDITW